MQCPKCGTLNEENTKFCKECGTGMPGAFGDTIQVPRIMNTAAKVVVQVAPEEFYKAVIGPKNQAYYLNQFARFDGHEKTSATWHWPALFVAFYWMLYRKMWLNAFLYFMAPYLALMVLALVVGFAGKSGAMVAGLGYGLFTIAMFALPAMYANALYYKHCKEMIAEVQASSKRVERNLGQLAGKGGTSGVVLILVLVMVFFGVIGILAAIAIPAYQDYTTRARTAQAVTVGKDAANAVANYYTKNQQVPVDMVTAGFNAVLPDSIKAIHVDNQDGTVTITMAKAPIADKSILLLPSMDASKNITWQCMSKDIVAKYLPKDCR